MPTERFLGLAVRIAAAGEAGRDPAAGEPGAPGGLPGRHIEHIRTIVQVQQNYAKTALMPEECDLAQLIDDALRIQLAALQRQTSSATRSTRWTPSPRAAAT
jgi:hypothetical protein